MKKFSKMQWKWLMMFLATTYAVGLTSCKDDDDDDEENTTIVGTWADLQQLERDTDQIFCLRINDDLTTSEMFWYPESDTFEYEDAGHPYTSQLVQEGDEYLAYNYTNGKRQDCTYTFSGDYLYDTHSKSVYTFKRIR